MQDHTMVGRTSRHIWKNKFSVFTTFTGNYLSGDSAKPPSVAKRYGNSWATESRWTRKWRWSGRPGQNPK